MKKNYILIALAMVAALTMVSCGDNKKAQNQEPAPEEIQAQKQALADSVLADIDAMAEQLYDTQSKSFKLKSIELTDTEKLVKPDYLLDPSVVSTLVTKSQKINALSILIEELALRKMYDMPCDEAKEAIAKLAAEVNHPIDVEYLTDDSATSEKIKRGYDVCKERGDVAYFWQCQYALMVEASYIVAQDPELFYSKITNEQWQVYSARFITVYKAVGELAKYDEEMSQLWEFVSKYRPYVTDEERDSINQDIVATKQYHIDNKDKYIARRNALLQ